MTSELRAHGAGAEDRGERIGRLIAVYFPPDTL